MNSFDYLFNFAEYPAEQRHFQYSVSQQILYPAGYLISIKAGYPTSRILVSPQSKTSATFVTYPDL
jgi:hypothetical protein